MDKKNFCESPTSSAGADLDRRNFVRGGLGLAATAGLYPWLGGCDDGGGGTLPEPVSEEEVFLHGVASGDPDERSLVIWTRVTSPLASRIRVGYELARDAAFADVVARGERIAESVSDYTAKFVVEGLLPDSVYHYRFRALGRESPVGQTRTTAQGAVSAVRLAIVSCASYAHGYFNVYRRIADRDDVDFVVHLGDYIYEYGPGEYGDQALIDQRPLDPPHETVTTEDYRRRYALYRRDPDLQALHARHPMIAVWDDHEFANNASRDSAENHSESAEPEMIIDSSGAEIYLKEGPWLRRKLAALTAWLEWMPVRETDEVRAGLIYRRFRFGDLADLIMLDTRLCGRDPQVNLLGALKFSEGRSLMGEAQRGWFLQQLDGTAGWKIVGNQVMFGQLLAGRVSGDPREDLYLNMDQWDGYQAERGLVLDHIESKAIQDVVVLTGDIHSAWAMDISRDPYRQYDPQTGAGALAVELVTTSVSSPALPINAPLQTNPHVRYAETRHRGYLRLEIGPDQLRADFHCIDSVASRESREWLDSSCLVERGRSRLLREA